MRGGSMDDPVPGKTTVGTDPFFYGIVRHMNDMTFKYIYREGF